MRIDRVKLVAELIRRDMSQKQLAELAGYPEPRSTISKVVSLAMKKLESRQLRPLISQLKSCLKNCAGAKAREKKNMNYHQSAAEQEVIINFDRTGDEANLYTADPVWIKKLDKLVSEHPESFKVRRQETYQGEAIAKDYTFPKRFITLLCMVIPTAKN